MGLHTDLSIHAAATKLLEAVTEGTLNMRRDAKPLVGRKMLDECLDITTLIQQANMERGDIGWARHLRAQCKVAGVAFFMKQLGTKPIPEALPGTVMRNPLPLPEGKSTRYKWHEPEHWPADLRVQEFPT